MQNNHDDDQNENDDLTEEELQAMFSNGKNPYRLGYQVGFILHANFGIHILLTLIINILTGIILVGLSQFSENQISYGIISVNMSSFFIGFTLYTVLEIIFKMILIKYLWKAVIRSFGLIFYVTNLITFFIVDMVISNHFEFVAGLNHDISNIFVFTLLFMAVRLLFTTYVRRSKFIQGGIKNVK